MANDAPPVDYTRPFWIEGPVGNNAFGYDRRGASPRIRVPSLRHGPLSSVERGGDIAFEDFDEHGALQSCTGLAHLLKGEWGGVPTVVVDNHNHAFYFWFEAWAAGRLESAATLVHLDQHRDTRVPARPLGTAATLADAFRYTNFLLNVGNYIVPAQQIGLVGDALLVTGEAGLGDFSRAGRPNTILNIDLDFFAPELSSIAFDRVRRFVDAHLPAASLVTIATSPFFIEQARAIEFLFRLLEGASG
jgi:hypothetical protein